MQFSTQTTCACLTLSINILSIVTLLSSLEINKQFIIIIIITVSRFVIFRKINFILLVSDQA